MTTQHPIDKPYRGLINLCRSNDDFECIVDLQYRSGDQRWRKASPVDSTGITWTVDSSGATSLVDVEAELKTPAFEDNDPWSGPLLWVDIHRHIDDNFPFRSERDLACNPAKIRTCVIGASPLPEDLELQVRIRTSWFKPVGASGYGSDADIEFKRIPGGILWTLSGREGLFPMGDANGPIDQRAPAMDARLYFPLIHADPAWNDTIFNDPCNAKGFPISTSNSTVGGPPMWNGEQIDFNMGAPHLDSSGKLYRGFFTAKLPTAWIACKWALRTFNRSEFSVEITNEDGEDVAATKALQVRNGQFRMVITGFHYSTPTISLKRKR